MLVHERMTRKLHVVGPETSTADAAALLRQHDIRHLPVVEGDRLVGILSDRDLVRLPSPLPTVGETMSRNLVVIAPGVPVDEAAELMREKRIDALPVLDETKRLVGLITSSDILQAFVELSGVGAPSFLLMLHVEGVEDPEHVVQSLASQHQVRVKWIDYNSAHRPLRMRLRVGARQVDDFVTALEAAGLEVTGMVGRPRGGV